VYFNVFLLVALPHKATRNLPILRDLLDHLGGQVLFEEGLEFAASCSKKR